MVIGLSWLFGYWVITSGCCLLVYKHQLSGSDELVQ